MVSYVLSELRAAKRYTRLLLDPMELLVSRVLDGCPTLQEKEIRNSDPLRTDLLGKVSSKRLLMELEMEIHLICLGILP
jgi:hypothetical protein